MPTLVIDPSAAARGIRIPTEYLWFIDGWNGFRYVVDENQEVCATNPDNSNPRPVAIWQQAIDIRKRIEAVIDEMNGLMDFIDYGLAVGYLRWYDNA